MKKIKAQQEICKALIKGDVVYRHAISEEEIGVVVSGVKGYVFKLEECVFDVGRLWEGENKTVFTFTEEDLPLDRTPLLLMYGDLLVRRYKAKDFSLYISEKHAKEFEDEYFFDSKEGDRVLVTDASRKIIGVVAPIIADEGMIKAIMGEG